tara:strand:- start:54741 stop:54896 length:156 start_codon:yes stop_codon:yes gene_type:complete
MLLVPLGVVDGQTRLEVSLDLKQMKKRAADSVDQLPSNDLSRCGLISTTEV